MAGDDEKRRRLKEEIEETEEDIRKLEEDQKQREERKTLAEEEELGTKSKILKRPTIELIRQRQPAHEKGLSKAEPDEKQLPWGMASGVTGTRPRGKTTPINAVTLNGIITEMIVRRWDSQLEERAQRGLASPQDLYRRMWIQIQLSQAAEEGQFERLKRLEQTSEARIRRLNDLTTLRDEGRLTEDLKRELAALQQEEAQRYYMREQFSRKIPMREQELSHWNVPFSDGAVGVMPYTYLTAWNMLPKNKRHDVLWYYDNTLLRWQSAIMAQYMPKAARLTWFGKAKMKNIEKLFDDINEEIYSDKAFAEEVKKGQAQLEDLEEELRGYDRFTEAEEQQIRKIYQEYMRTQLALAREEEFYG